jgi:hypothetical protein
MSAPTLVLSQQLRSGGSDNNYENILSSSQAPILVTLLLQLAVRANYYLAFLHGMIMGLTHY